MTLDEARAALLRLRPRLDALLALRADLAELGADLEAGRPGTRGGLADLKAMQARVYNELERMAETGALVKGYAPLLLDFPGQLAEIPVLWCWLEGEPGLNWYHRADAGFAGRRPVPAEVAA